MADPPFPHRPFQRTVTVHKDSTGHVGIVVKKGKIVSLAKDSSAARNGLLTHHYICEVNGQNVIGMKVGAVHSRRCRTCPAVPRIQPGQPYGAAMGCWDVGTPRDPHPLSRRISSSWRCWRGLGMW